MEIRPLDATDDAALAAWHATYAAAATHGIDFPTVWQREEVRADLTSPSSGERIEAFSGYVDGECVTTGLVVMPQKDNLDLAAVEAHTRPESRRRGHGSEMLEHLVGLAGDAKRAKLVAEVAFPYDCPADGAGHPDVEFLRRRGFAYGIGNVLRVLDLPVDDDRLAAFAQEAAPHHTAYTFRQFKNRVPDDIIEGFGELIGTLVTEAPLGEIELEQEVFDAERIREDEARLVAAGREKYTTVALSDDGDVVAYSEIGVPHHEPDRLYQWGTLVAPAHRGHRLGLATKVLNLRWLQREQTGRTHVVTWNAEVNDAMIAVNEHMGFHPVQRHAEYQRLEG